MNADNIPPDPATGRAVRTSDLPADYFAPSLPRTLILAAIVVGCLILLATVYA